MKQPQVSLSYPPLGLTGCSIEEEEVNWWLLSGDRPVQQRSVAFGYRVCYGCRCAGGSRY